MKFSELTKQNQLLIYMYVNKNTNRYPFTIANDGDAVIIHGITANKKSLSSMLNALANKELIESDGYCGWYLTDLGIKIASTMVDGHDVDKLDKDEDITFSNDDSNEQPPVSKKDPVASAFENMNKAFDCMNKVFAAMNGQPKENHDDIVKKLDAIEAGLKLVNDNAIKNSADIDCLHSFLKDILSDDICVKISTIFTRNVALAKTVNALLDEIVSIKSQLTA